MFCVTFKIWALTGNGIKGKFRVGEDQKLKASDLGNRTLTKKRKLTEQEEKTAELE